MSLQRTKTILHDFTDSNGREHSFTVRQFLEALDDAKDTMNYSNYHCDKFSRIQKIIREWAKDRKIPLGPTIKQREAIQRRKDKKIQQAIADGDGEAVLKLFEL